MPFRSLDDGTLRSIADAHSIDYVPLDTRHANGIATRMSRKFQLSKTALFDKIANLKDHTRLFSHLKAVIVVRSEDIGGAIGKNQFVIVEGLEEGGSKLGVKLITITPNHKIECELLTDPFDTARADSADNPSGKDRKRGAISWQFDDEPNGTSRMTVQSDFQVEKDTAYVRGTIDHVWMDFFENVMLDTKELSRNKKRAAPFGEGNVADSAGTTDREKELAKENHSLKLLVADLSLEVKKLKESRNPKSTAE